jgi:hypothetical protein
MAWAIRVSIRVKAKRFPFLQNVQTGSGAHAAYSIRAAVLFLEAKRPGRDVALLD